MTNEDGWTPDKDMRSGDQLLHDAQDVMERLVIHWRKRSEAAEAEVVRLSEALSYQWSEDELEELRQHAEAVEAHVQQLLKALGVVMDKALADTEKNR